MSSPEGFTHRSVERAALGLFRRAFQVDAVLTARGPGRVLLMGERAGDYEGLALASAMEQEVRIAARPRDESRVRLVLGDREGPVEFDATEPDPQVDARWARPVAAVAAALREAGHTLRGFDGALVVSVPADLGLAPSAAVVVAAAALFRAISELDIDDATLARLCARAAEASGGEPGHAIDLLAGLVAQAGRAVWIDGGDLASRTVAMPPALRVVVLDGGARAGSDVSDRGRRRDECATAAAALREHDPEVASLRDITPEEMSRWEERLPAVLAKRVRYAVGENERVKLAAAALEQNETERFGELVFASHRSLRDDYEVTRPELEALVDFARGAPGVVGAKGSASGRGTINVVAAAWVDEFIERVQHRYHERFGTRPDAYVTAPAGGAAVAKVTRE